MTTYNKTTLKTFFQTGDRPTGTDYANFIDSYINIVETTTQTMAGALNPTELITPRVSATTIFATNNIICNTMISAGNINASGIVSATTVDADNLIAGTANFFNDISATNGTIYVSAVRTNAGVFNGVGIISATGSTQSTAAQLTFAINRGKGVVDGQTTGFAIPANRTGLIQYIFNEGVSANLWPPTGGFINGLAVNVPFSLAASTSYTIFHLTASAYGVR